MKLETRQVLAAAYPGRRWSNPATTLTHAVEDAGPCERNIPCQCCGSGVARFGIPLYDGEFELCDRCERCQVANG